MANCNHSSAQCVIGNFYTCKVEGCSNGPARAERAQAARTEASKFLSDVAVVAASYALPEGLSVLYDDGEILVRADNEDGYRLYLRRDVDKALGEWTITNSFVRWVLDSGQPRPEDLQRWATGVLGIIVRDLERAAPVGFRGEIVTTYRSDR